MLFRSLYIKKGISPLEVVLNLNNEQKVKAFMKQAYAGRDNMEDVTTSTLIPYFSLFRLSDALAGTGLNLSPSDTGSVTQIAANITMKRVLKMEL